MPGGFLAHRFDGAGWEPGELPGVRLAVGPSGEPAVVDVFGVVSVRARGTWSALPGRVLDVAFAPDGALWAVGRTAGTPTQQLLRWDGDGWAVHESAGTRLTIGRDGHPVLLSANGVVVRETGFGWEALYGLFSDVEAGAAGALYGVGIDDAGYELTAEGWRRLADGVAEIAIGGGQVWLLTRRGSIVRSLI
jgi:hypothetical protein